MIIKEFWLVLYWANPACHRSCTGEPEGAWYLVFNVLFRVEALLLQWLKEAVFVWVGFEEDSVVGESQLQAGADFWAGCVCSNCSLNFQLRFGVGTRNCPLFKGPVLIQHKEDRLINSTVLAKVSDIKSFPQKAAFLNLLPWRFEEKVTKQASFGKSSSKYILSNIMKNTDSCFKRGAQKEVKFC